MISRKSAIILATVTLAAAYTGYWFYARAVAVEIIENWTEQRRAEGYTVAYNGPTIGGFPLLIRGVLEDLHLQREAFTWRGERMLIELQPWNFRRIRVDLNGKQLITAKAGKEQMTLAPMEMAVVVTLSETNRLADATLLVRDLNVSDPAGMSLMQTAEIWMEATTPDVLTASHEDTSLILSISAADVQLPQAVDGPLGRTMSKLRADLQIRGNVPGGALGKALEAWRHSGGTVDVNWLQVNWGEFDLRAKGTLALDAEARPLGAFSTDIRGYNQALDTLVAYAALEQSAATMAKVGLSLLAKSPAEGGPPVLTLPLTAQDGHLYAGPLKILDLDPIRLPEFR